MKIKILKPLNDVLHVGRVTDVAKDVALLLIKQGDAEAYVEEPPLIEVVTEPNLPTEKPKK